MDGREPAERLYRHARLVCMSIETLPGLPKQYLTCQLISKEQGNHAGGYQFLPIAIPHLVNVLIKI